MKYNDQIQRAEDRLRTAYINEYEAAMKRAEAAKHKAEMYLHLSEFHKDQMGQIVQQYQNFFGQNLAKLAEDARLNDAVPVPQEEIDPYTARMGDKWPKKTKPYRMTVDSGQVKSIAVEASDD